MFVYHANKMYVFPAQFPVPLSISRATLAGLRLDNWDLRDTAAFRQRKRERILLLRRKRKI